MTTSTARAQRAIGPFSAGAAVAVGLSIAVGLALAVDLRIGVALAFAVVGVPLALLDPPLIIALWAALTVFSRYPGAGLAMSATALLVLGAWLARARTERGRMREALRTHRRLLIILALLLSWLTVSVAWTQDVTTVGGELSVWYINAAALVVLLTSLRTQRDVHVVVAAVVLAVSASVALGLAGVELSPASSSAPETATSSQGRLQGVAGDPNFMAAFIVPSVVLALVLLRTAVSRARGFLVPLIALLMVGLAATESRGGMLAALATLPVALVVMRGRRAAVMGTGLTVLLIGAVWIAATPAALERLQAIRDDRGNGREALWVVAWRMSADHPVTGVGLDNFVVRSREYVRRPGRLEYVDLVVERPHVVHNTYLQMLAETGVVGLGLFVLLAWTALTSAGRAARRFEQDGRRALGLLARGVLAADVGLGVAATFISAQLTATVWLLLALGPILLGLACAARAAPHSSAATSARPPVGGGRRPFVRTAPADGTPA
jgi:O-antigen ligase